METRERREVKHSVKKAITLHRSFGKKETLALVADPKGPFIEGERYVFALDTDGRLLAHPYSKELVGRSLVNLQDSQGQSFVREMLTKVKRSGNGFIGYMWPVPDTKEELYKIVFFEKVDGLILCSGFYAVKDGPLEAMYIYLGPFMPF